MRSGCTDIEEQRENNNSQPKAGAGNIVNYFLSEDYENYFVEYVGDIIKSFQNIDYATIYITNRFFAYLFVKNGRINELLKSIPEIVNVQKSYPYTLSALKRNEKTDIFNVVDRDTVDYFGEGVIVGIISTGIDYLSKSFMDLNGNTRILRIWDQTVQSEAEESNFTYGRVYTEMDINNAIKVSALGEDPYKIVNHRDELGDGTAIAGVIGGDYLGAGNRLVSVAPRCQYAIVKLKEAKKSTLRINGIEDAKVPVYEATDIATAIGYLSQLKEEINKPMVVYLAAGTNFGGHDGGVVIERYIDFETSSRNFGIVTNTGNQGNGDIHTSGTILSTGDTKNISLSVDENERNLSFSIYLNRPDVVAITIITPDGKTTDKISIPSNIAEISNIILDKYEVIVQFFLETLGSGDQRIDIVINNTTGGIWTIALTGEYIVDGRYDSWLIQREFLENDTRFIEVDTNITLMIPGTSNNIINTSYYNEKTNTIVPEAGRGFTRDGRIKPSVAVSAENILTVGLNNSLIVASGAAIAGAILAGTAALVYEWGIVKGNDRNLLPPKVRNYLITGTIKFEGYAYPNRQWGFGALSIEKLFKELNKISSNSREEGIKSYSDILIDRNVINIPSSLYDRLKMDIL